MTSTGHSIIVAGPKGEKKVPVYIRKAGSLACGEHAMLPIQKGDTIITATHHRKDFAIHVYDVSREPDASDTLLELAIIASFERGEWSGSAVEGGKLPEYLKGAVDAAKQKAQEYHCRRPMWVVDQE